MSTTCSPEHQPDEPTLKRPGPDTRTVTLAPERKRQKLHLSSLWLMLQRPRKIRLPPDDIWFEDHQRWMRKRNYLLLLLNALKYHNGLYSICIVALRQIFESTCQMVEFTELMKTLQTAWTRRRSSNIGLTSRPATRPNSSSLWMRRSSERSSWTTCLKEQPWWMRHGCESSSGPGAPPTRP